MVAFIDEHRDVYGVEPICDVLPIAPSTYYAHRAKQADPSRRSQRAQRDEALVADVRRVWQENKSVYGAPVVTGREEPAVERPPDAVADTQEAGQHLAADNLADVDPELLLAVLGDPPDEASLLPVRQRRLDWAALLQRVFKIDVLRCPRCAGRMTVLAAITSAREAKPSSCRDAKPEGREARSAVNDPTVAQKILRHLGLPTDGPRCAPARAPPELELDLDSDALDPDAGFEDDIEPDDGFDPDVDVDPDFAD